MLGFVSQINAITHYRPSPSYLAPIGNPKSDKNNFVGYIISSTLDFSYFCSDMFLFIYNFTFVAVETNKSFQKENPKK